LTEPGRKIIVQRLYGMKTGVTSIASYAEEDELQRTSTDDLPGATQLILICGFSFAAVLDNPITAALLAQ
jgi:hypothetical protein